MILVEAVFPAASHAVALIVCVPGETFRVFQLYVYGAAASVAFKMPST